MNTAVVNLADAHAAIARGDLAGAHGMLSGLLRGSATDADLRHAMAVVERRLGNLTAARLHFEAALSERPLAAEIHNNYANCLRDAGEPDAAVGHYRRAIELVPQYPDALINLGLVLRRLGRSREALEFLRRAAGLEPPSARAWHGLGMALWDEGELECAAAALDEALRLAPADVRLLHARARLDALRGRTGTGWYRRALQLAPDDAELRLGHAVACFESGDTAVAVDQVRRLVDEDPGRVKAHAALAQMRWQLGESAAFARSFDAAVDLRPRDLELRIGQFGTLMRAGRYTDVLARLDAARAMIPADDLFDRYEAVCASESGDLGRADAAFKRQEQCPDDGLRVARLRHLLRSGRYHEAAAFGEQVVLDPGCMGAWPYLGLAWRLLGDQRFCWLDGEGRLVSHIDFDGLADLVQRLGRALRGAHRARCHPFDQSLRGGTQSDGHLLFHGEPELREVRRLIEDGVRRYIAGLPAKDPRHPFLRHRDDEFHIGASYSVWLRGQGFHINHVHPEAWISCCFYVDVPDSLSRDAADPAGWLVIGEPPSELGLGLPPTAAIRPEPGRLAVFPSIMWHGTVPFASGERLTIVSDLFARDARGH